MSELNDSNNNNNERAIYISNSNSTNLEEIEQNDIHNEPSAIIISSPDISPSRISSGVTINFANFTGFLAPQANDIFGSGSSVSWTANSSSNEAGYRSSSSALMSTTNSSRDGSDSETRGTESERTSLDNNSSPFGIENFVRNSQADFIEDLTKPSIKRNEASAEIESNDNNTNKILKGEKEENDVCSICLEKWADSGPHQISSTKCGHLFGKSCILRWISSSNSDYSKCPTCNQKASRNDIRPLFVGNLAVKDQRELDNLHRIIREKEHTICRVNNELIGYRHSNLKANAQIGFLEGQLNSLRKRKFNGDLNNIVNQGLESNTNSIQIYPMDLRYKLSNSASLPTRSLAYIEEHDILLVGKQMDLESQGVMAISQLSNPTKAQKTISLGHQSQIKNIKTFITPSGRIFSLSGGMDCNLIYRKHSIQGKEKFVKTEILHSFKLQNKVFSCCFNTEDPNIFYAAGIGGTLYYFNLMVKTDGPAKVFQPQILKGPTIIFLDFLPQTGHLVVVTLKDVFIAKLTLDEEEIYCIKRYASGNMGIFSVSHISNQTYLFSLRHLDESYVEHRIAKFEFVFTQSVHTNRYRGENNENQGASNTDLGYEFNTLNNYTNAGKQLNMTQTAAFQNPIDFNHILIASPGQNDNSVIVRSVRENESITDDIQLPNSETVNYLKFIRIGKKFNNEDEDDEEFYVDEGPESAPAVQPTADNNEVRSRETEEVGAQVENKEFENPQPLMTNKEEKALINIRLLVLTNQSVYLYKICYSGELTESY